MRKQVAKTNVSALSVCNAGWENIPQGVDTINDLWNVLLLVKVG